MKNLLIATTNQGKLIEIRDLLKGVNVDLVLPRDLGLDFEVVEDGHTYAENAAKKAVAFAQASGLLTLADDSGLEVDALNGQPGIYSARFSEKPGATDADRCAYLVHRLQGKPSPWTARFRCLVALAQPGQVVRFAEGVCQGEILPQPRGTQGFGYDPLFLLPELGRSMAELTMEEKNHFSHRARAVLAALPHLTAMLGD